MKGQKFTVVREFRPRLSSLTRLQTNCCMSKARRGREVVRGAEVVGRGGGTDERNDSRRQRRGEGLTFPSTATKAKLLLPPQCTEGDEGKRKRGKMEGLKVTVGGRKVFGDMEVCGWVAVCGVQVFGYFVHAGWHLYFIWRHFLCK